MAARHTSQVASYEALEALLRQAESDTVTLELTRIEAVIGGALPADAHRQRAWWSNYRAGGHWQAAAWLNARRRVDDVGLDTSDVVPWVTFARFGMARSSWADLFDPPPVQWGLRGDPHVWAAMARKLRYAPVPRGRDDALAAVHDAFVGVVGADPEQAGHDDFVVREEFAHGGMSSGGVALWVWRERLLPMLASRAADR